MANKNYDKFRPKIVRIMNKWAQGDATYNHPNPPTGDPWSPVDGGFTSYPISSTKMPRGVAQEYADGTTVLVTDSMIQFPPIAVEPKMSGTITKNGKVMQIVMIDPVTDEGVPLMWRVACRG